LGVFLHGGSSSTGFLIWKPLNKETPPGGEILSINVYAFAIKSMVHCGSAFESGASGLLYYCALSVNVPDVMGERALW